MDGETLTLIGMVLGPAIIAGIGGYLLPRMAPYSFLSRKARAFLIVAPMLIALSTTIWVLNYYGVI